MKNPEQDDSPPGPGPETSTMLGFDWHEWLHGVYVPPHHAPLMQKLGEQLSRSPEPLFEREPGDEEGV